MTPTEILDDVKGRFMVLYLDQADQLNRLLRQALGKYQDKAGILLETWQEEGVFNIPANFHSVAACCDSKRRYVSWWRVALPNTIEPSSSIPPDWVIMVKAQPRHAKPYCMYYFVDLRHWDLDTPLPGDCDALVADYLEALIALHNTKREREAYILAGMSEAAQGLPTEQELRQRILELELAMEDNKAITPPASMF